MPKETRKVSVEGNRLRFAAAHFATFGGQCEPLHGHNYILRVEVEGDLTEDSWVWDFGDLKARSRALCEELDHKFLLQRHSRLLRIEERPGEWEVAFGENARYVFPRQDVIPLPIDNSTAERLAEWIAGRLAQGFERDSAPNLRRLTVGVEEMPGQAGWYTVDL